MRMLRLWLARQKLRRIHEAVEHADHTIAQAARDLDRLLSSEKDARSALFALEHPHLFRNNPSRVYGTPARIVPMRARR